MQQFFFRGMQQRHWKPSTFVAYHRHLTVFFRWCVEHGHLPLNPVDGIALPRQEKSIRPKLTRDQAERLLAYVENYPYRLPFERFRNHALLATMLLAGLRSKETLKLQLADVDVVHRTIFVRQGKGHEGPHPPYEPAAGGDSRALLRGAGSRRARPARKCSPPSCVTRA